MLIPGIDPDRLGESGDVVGEGLVGLVSGNQALTETVEGAGLVVLVAHFAE